MTTSLLVGPFQFLLTDYAFRIAVSEVSPYFDNMFVDMTNGTINVRIARDRGCVVAEVSSAFAPERLLPISLLRQVVLHRDPMENVTLDDQAEFIRSHLSTVTDLLSPENLDDTERRVIQLGGERFK